LLGVRILREAQRGGKVDACAGMGRYHHFDARVASAKGSQWR
jgi:hypothetical protein